MHDRNGFHLYTLLHFHANNNMDISDTVLIDEEIQLS